jgi:hypothetical protein
MTKRDWIWKRLANRSIVRLRPGAPRPALMFNKHGRLVRFHAPHAITPAIERFASKVLKIMIGDDECWLWFGATTFRVDDDNVTTPQRFAYQEVTGEVLTRTDLLIRTCGTPGCCRPLHRERRRKRALIAGPSEKVFYMA